MTALATVQDPRELALLKAVGLDRVAPEQRDLAIHIAERYDLDLMLKHLVLIDGRPYITRDGLLHIAHRSGVFDGVEVTVPEVVDGYWRCTASIYRKDMSRPFTYPGRYPATGGNQKYGPEMCIKVAESMGFRRAFDVAAPTQDEKWDVEHAPEVVPPAPVPTLAQRVAEKAAEVAPEAAPVVDEAPAPAEDVEDADVVEIATGVSFDAEPRLLTKAQLGDLMTKHEIPPTFVRDVARQMFPDKPTADLTDAERGRVADEILSRD